MRRRTRSEYDRLRAELPYGMWTCADGREVLFNRDYEPFLQRRDGVVGEPEDAVNSYGVRWVHGIATQGWFFTDATPHAARIARGEAVLEEFRAGRSVAAHAATGWAEIEESRRIFAARSERLRAARAR